MILSVDWDWFVPEDVLWDLGHRENEMFLNFLWHTRGHLVEEMKTSGQEVDFWEKIRKIVDLQATEINVSESHLSALRLVEPSDEPLILVDAHHDCWPLSLKGRVDCSNWVNAWIRYGRAEGVNRTVFWVIPSAEARELCESRIQKEVRKNVMIQTLEQLTDMATFGKAKVEVVHACRSGCWTPPWLDKDWLAFLMASQLRVKVMDPEPWDGIRERWTESDLQSAIALDKSFQSMKMSISKIKPEEKNED